jgi:hypothetical protein
MKQRTCFEKGHAFALLVAVAMVLTVLVAPGRTAATRAACALHVLGPFVESSFAPHGIWGGANYNCARKHSPRSLKVCLQKESSSGCVNVKCDTLKESGPAAQIPAGGGFFGPRKSCPIKDSRWRTWARARAGSHGPVVRTSAPVTRDC